MKNQITLLLVCLGLSLYSSAQVIEVTPSYGYQFGTRIDYGPGYVKAEPSGQWGIAAGVEISPGMVAKLSYTSMGTEVRVRDIAIQNNQEVRLSDLQNDWFLLGIQKYFKDGKVKPFAGGGLGLVIVSPKNESTLNCTGPACLNPPQEINLNLSSNTYFAFNFEAGVNIMFSDYVGINVQGNLYFPVNYGGFYVGTGGAGFSTGSTQIVGGFSGGLVFRFDTN